MSPNTQADSSELRRLAEERLQIQSPPANAPRSAHETQRLLHELQVHQIELEMQNEALLDSRTLTEAAVARYTELYDFAPMGYLTLDPSGTITQVNLAGARLLDLERSLLTGKLLGAFVTESDRPAFNTFLKQAFANQLLQTCEVGLLIKDTHSLIVNITAMLTADGNECRMVLVDITERKHAEAERENLHALLSQARKMESVGRLAGGVAHDFNNMLQAILCNVDLAMTDLPHANSVRDHLDEIQKCAQRSAALTRQLLTFARKQTAAPKILDLNVTVEGMLNLLRRLIGEDIDIIWRPAAGLPPVKIDPSHIDQILANLSVNARDAITGIGKIIIETGSALFDAAHCSSQPGCVPGDYVMLAVSDDGCGMDKETKEHLFEPFFTTKPVGQGTGLGLANVYGVVTQNLGFITVHSEPGNGTTFKIYLPGQVVTVAPIEENDASPLACRGNETILLVDDEQAIARIGKLVLENLGYTVLAASTPHEAIRLAEEHPGDIHLLLTDVVMPAMNGQDLAQRLLVLFPNIKLLFMSGYTSDVVIHCGKSGEKIPLIEKPFSIATLADKVRDSLKS